MEDRVVNQRNDKGHPVTPIEDLGHCFDGTPTKDQLRKLMKLCNLSHKKFWVKYMSNQCAFSTWRTWYTTNKDARVPQFLLVHLTARYSELYELFKKIK